MNQFLYSPLSERHSRAGPPEGFAALRCSSRSARSCAPLCVCVFTGRQSPPEWTLSRRPRLYYVAGCAYRVGFAPATSDPLCARAPSVLYTNRSRQNPLRGSWHRGGGASPGAYFASAFRIRFSSCFVIVCDFPAFPSNAALVRLPLREIRICY